MERRKIIIERRARRSRRTRAGIFGTAAKPRLSVFRSNKSVYVQLIDDENHRTLASSGGRGGAKKTAVPVAQADEAGRAIAERAAKLGITEAIFDRGAYKYHGRVKAVADGARKAGLKI